MNFKRIQWIFILAFLLFDIFVGSSLILETRFTVSNGQPNRQSTVLKEMHNDSISYGDLSNKQQTGYYVAGKRSTDGGVLEQESGRLHNQNAHFSSGTLTSDFDKPIKLSKDNPLHRVNRLLKNKKMVALGDNYRYNRELSDKNNIVYTQMLEGKPLISNDGQIRFHVNSDHELTGYTQTYLQDVEILRQRSNTISQQRAVTWLYKHNQIPNNSRIRWASLSYAKLLNTTTDDKAVYVPTWVVEIKTKNSGAIQQLEVNAFNSTVMKETPDSVNTNSLNNK
ncbi:two-component system regulatory protein YycI [Limosilactobacillus sp. STM2_1]|uniref:Two-component system regulatory protein YycI n=1 Tax=Limosilactobacillus rudii TaxID=2759755 RepID=A0A7W3UJ68_9LACO|nr:two-component system regulatory protein YycI [Limosilactobacillus rudii]MBB1078433.1 two-component system regulatory protein YycI [Limosilactobacillus rudii]MBB1096563.1 two-component system regulatory protein YycI [Limosilactobacillus rudii]MCD7134241.1 two-component system regulatory protein YycI [Limosilactobacillus rudii]